MQLASLGGSWDQSEGPDLLFRRSRVVASWQQHLVEYAKCFLGAFRLEEAKTRGFLCSASKPAAMASPWGNTSPKYFTSWCLLSPSLATWSVAELVALGQDALLPPVPPAYPQGTSFGNPFFGDAPALAPSRGAASEDVCSEMKFIDLTRVSHGTAALLRCHELPNPSRREKREFLWLGILSAHAWSTPAGCCCPNPPGKDQAAHGSM